MLSTCFLLGCSACGKDGSSSSSGNYKADNGYTFAAEDHITYQGIHEYDVQDVEGEYLVKDGKTDYALVVPSDGSALITNVKADFGILFKKATGIAIPSKFDNEVVDTWDTSKKYISIGLTSLVEKAGISEEEYSEYNIKTEGVRIITKGNTVFLLNTHDFGVSNAMYTFMEIYFNFDYYHRNCITIDTGVTNMAFKNIDVTDIPDVEHYMGAHNIYTYYQRSDPWDADALGADTYTQEGKFMGMRLRSLSNAWEFPIYTDFDTSSRSTTSHSALTILPRNMTFTIPRTNEVVATDPKMFSDKGNQLCLSGHGDPEIYERMIKICTEKLIFSLIHNPPSEQPYKRGFAITVEDNFYHCDCAACLKDYEKYASSGQFVRFINEVGKRVNEWLKETADPDHEYHSAYRDYIVPVYMFGYHQDVDPPVDAIQNPDGTVTYVPKDESVVFNEYASLWMVSSNSLRLGGYNDVQQGNTNYHLPGWDAVSNGKNNYVYWFNSPLLNRDYAYDPFTTYSKDFWAVMAYYGYADVYSDHYGQGNELSGWQNLLTYINSKLRWDSNKNPNELIQKYMKAMYKDASDIMYDIYRDQLNYYVNIRANKADPSRPGGVGSVEEYPYVVLDGWVKRFEEAIELISFYQEIDVKTYNVLRTRIQVEMATEVTKILSLYATNAPFGSKRLNEYKAVMRELGEKSPVMSVNGKTADKWGV